MANKTTAELTAGTTTDGTELYHGVQSGNSRKLTGLQILTPDLEADDQHSVRTSFGAALKGHIYGLALSNNASDANNDIDVAAGEAASVQSDPLLMVFAGLTGGQLDVAFGTGNGIRFDTSVSDGTWYLFLISDGTTVALGASKSADPTGQANYPSGYTHYRAIGFVVRASSANLKPHLVGDELEYESAEQSVTTAGTLTLNHGLARQPRVHLWLRCKTAEGGYTAGEEIALAPTMVDPGGASNRGLSTKANASQIVVYLGNASNVITIMSASANAPLAITNGNWKIIARASAGILKL